MSNEADLSKEAGITHEEQSSSPYATPFVENPELEKKCVRASVFICENQQGL
jgi:hypothetical protein